MYYRVVRVSITELDESKDYSKEDLELHRTFNPGTSKVVWRGNHDKEFGERFLRDPSWSTHEDWSDGDSEQGHGWVSSSYQLERLSEETKKWQLICHVQPVFISDEDYDD